MTQPVWITPVGSLGTIPEGVFFQIPLLAQATGWIGDVNYEIIAGKLPLGMQCEDTGLITGIPFAIASVQGVPATVNADVTSKFAVRAYTTTDLGAINRLADRTFTITVTGQDTPEFITPPGQVGQFFDGSPIESIQIEYTNDDPSDEITIRVVSGKLPEGLTISSIGEISGYVTPLSINEQLAGFSRDGQGLDEYPFDFSTRSSSTNYQFVLEISDGKSSNLRTFSIFIISKNSLSTDLTDFTADTTFITADGSPVRTPFIITPQGSLGRIRADNFFAYQFKALDFDGDLIEFSLSVGALIGFDADGTTFDQTGVGFDRGNFSLPPGLTLDQDTGWLYGYIPNQGLTEVTYNFAVRVYKVNDPLIISPYYYYSIDLVGDIDTDVTWLTNFNLGSIDTGDTSTFNIQAVNAKGYSLQYKLKSGSNSKLPQGLTLLSSGNICGRVSFNTFALDHHTTTFDITLNDLVITGEDTETIFDSEYTFTVNAFSSNGFVSVFKEFTIIVNHAYDEPYQNLYISAMPSENDRALIQELLENQDIFPPELLYRNDDLNFGRAQKVIYNHAFGLTASILDDYVASVNINHYWKNLTLGEIRTARALDSDGKIMYEVVYCHIIDNLVNAAGESVKKEVLLPYPINLGDSTQVSTVYPNSLINMRDQIIDQIGQPSKKLPIWMTSKQDDGRILGFSPAWVLSYTKPNKSKQIAYQIQQIFGNRLNLINFKADRYILDKTLSINWDPIADSTEGAWFPTPAETTFDSSALPNDITYFDGSSLRFIAPIDIYINTDSYDKYIMFPKQTILG